MSSGILGLSFWQLVLATLALTHVTIAGVTIFLHRHQAHRALDLHPIVSHFFRLWLWLTTGMATKEWAAIHRKHHAKCETPEDPHSPQILGINRVLWTGVFLYVKESRNAETLARYGHGTPDDWLERNVYFRFQKSGIVLMLLADIALFGLPGLFVWGIQMAWIPFWAAGVINGVGHYFGYRNFRAGDASTNIFPIGILIGGEELHNNHHAYASSAKLSSKWYEFDIGWMYIRIMEMLGLARVKKTAPKLRLAAAKQQCDIETLQAVITHRYEVLAKYAKTLKSIYVEEIGRMHGIDLPLIRKWLHIDAGDLDESSRRKLDLALDMSQPLKTVYTMRHELEALWARSAASKEQLVRQLDDWCGRAEASGIAQLQAFSLRLRSYA
ncbi:MAG: fatty acid desaturase [Burkholderiales bacterium]|nr:fatty acid desaturase [Burkholderiales bacterium]